MKIRYFAMAVVLWSGVAVSVQAQDPKVEQRVQGLLGKLSSQEKLDLLSGVDGFYTKSIERQGIPRLKMSDGPVGTRNDGPTTAYPAGVALAATWDPVLARQEGNCLGRNGRARGDHFLLGPGVNIYRVPQNGRNFEYFGEDPFLSGQMASAYILGVQEQGVAACVKHYAGNNQETERDFVDDSIDERTLHEIYLPAFEAAVKQGHVQSVMAAYNRVNGDYMTANQILLNDVLKKQWGFTGVLMSDWGATHDTLGPANAGLDLEMPSGIWLNPKKLAPLMQDGKVSQATIDDKVRRLLRVMVTMKWLDRPQKDSSIPLDDPQSNATALQVAREGIVLLKNEGNLLPLDRSKLHTIVLVGPNPSRYIAGRGSSLTEAFHSTTIADGVRKIAGDQVKVVVVPYTRWLDDSLDEFSKESQYVGNGFKADYYNNMDMSGEPAVSRVDKTIHFPWRHRHPAKQMTSESFSARWTGKIHPTSTGSYIFAVSSDDGSRVKLDGKTILEDWSDHEQRPRSVNIDLKADQTYDVVVEYYNSHGDADISFGWGQQTELLTSQDKSAIASADVVLACVGTRETEGADRSYELMGQQNELIKAVTQSNPKTIVILNAGGNVAMKDWIDGVPALLDAWYAGQEGGQAIAEILFGQFNPSGHLPDTFEKQWEDSPAFGNYPGENRKVNYAEGIYVGYRWFDKKKIEPRFCFGQGLSYSTFSIDHLKIDSDGSNDRKGARVECNVTNSGNRAGAEVVQVYVRPPQGQIDRPIQELKGFERVELKPGETKTISIKLDERAFAFWDVTAHDWKSPSGEYEIAVGRSSRDICCTGKLDWK